jgi:hypothetical protein
VSLESGSLDRGTAIDPLGPTLSMGDGPTVAPVERTDRIADAITPTARRLGTRHRPTTPSALTPPTPRPVRGPARAPTTARRGDELVQAGRVDPAGSAGRERSPGRPMGRTEPPTSRIEFESETEFAVTEHSRGVQNPNVGEAPRWSVEITEDNDASAELRRTVHDALHEAVKSITEEEFVNSTRMNRAEIFEIRVQGPGPGFRLIFDGDDAQLSAELSRARHDSELSDRSILRYLFAQLARALFISLGIPDPAARFLGHLVGRWLFGPASGAERAGELVLGLVERLLPAGRD